MNPLRFLELDLQSPTYDNPVPTIIQKIIQTINTRNGGEAASEEIKMRTSEIAN